MRVVPEPLQLVEDIEEQKIVRAMTNDRGWQASHALKLTERCHPNCMTSLSDHAHIYPSSFSRLQLVNEALVFLGLVV